MAQRSGLTSNEANGQSKQIEGEADWQHIMMATGEGVATQQTAVGAVGE